MNFKITKNESNRKRNGSDGNGLDFNNVNLSASGRYITFVDYEAGDSETGGLKTILKNRRALSLIWKRFFIATYQN